MNDKNANKTIAKFVEAARIKRSLTQNELADKAGLSRSLLSMIENGDRTCSLIHAIKIAKALEISMDQLLQNMLPTADDFVSVVNVKEIKRFEEMAEKLYFAIKEAQL